MRATYRLFIFPYWRKSSGVRTRGSATLRNPGALGDVWRKAQQNDFSSFRYKALKKQGCIVSKSFGNHARQRRQRPIRRDRDGKRRWFQVSILERDKNQTSFAQFSFYADRRAKGNSSTVSNQRHYEGWFGRCNCTSKLERSSLYHSIEDHSIGN